MEDRKSEYAKVWRSGDDRKSSDRRSIFFHELKLVFKHICDRDIRDQGAYMRHMSEKLLGREGGALLTMAQAIRKKNKAAAAAVAVPGPN